MPEKRTSAVKEAVQDRFSQVAANYRTSQVHAQGAELERMLQLVKEQGATSVLDAGCGPGHTALAVAPHVDRVTALDLSPQMLEQGRLLACERQCLNVSFERGDVEELPFPTGSFDAIVSRFSAHHWPDPPSALRNFHRVLKPGSGIVLLADTVSFVEPSLDTYLQAIELLRDPSHVRDHTPEQWLAMFQDSGFSVQLAYAWNLRLDFEAWISRMATPSAVVEVIRKLMRNAPSEIQNALQIEEDCAFTLRCALFRASMS